MSNILKNLKVSKFDILYIKAKLSFLDTIKNNEIIDDFIEIISMRSFQNDIVLL